MFAGVSELPRTYLALGDALVGLVGLPWSRSRFKHHIVDELRFELASCASTTSSNATEIRVPLTRTSRKEDQ